MKVCPKNVEHTTFSTTAHVTQLWVVDGDGAFQEVLDDCDQVIAYPNKDDEWICQTCGAVAVER